MAKKRKPVRTPRENEDSFDFENLRPLETWIDEDGFEMEGDKPPWYEGLIKYGYNPDDEENIKSGRLRERTDQIGRLLRALKYLVTRTRSPEDTVHVPARTMVEIIQALERLPWSQGNPRGLGWLGKALEEAARAEALKLKQQRIDKGEKAIDAEAHAAKDARAIFQRITGRTHKTGTIQRIMQGKRSARKSRR